MTKKTKIILIVSTLVLAVTIVLIFFVGNTSTPKERHNGGISQNLTSTPSEKLSEDLPLEAEPYSDFDDNGESYVEGEINKSDFELCKWYF